MALAIGVHPKDRIYIGDIPVTVVTLEGYERAILRVNDKELSVSDRKAVEILPEVMVSCGRPSDRRVVKNDILFEAVNKEWKQRQEAVAAGKISVEEYDNLPLVEIPRGLLPRLVFDAPEHIVILRSSLYHR